ncbi:MAG: threonine--tRNA ligase [Neisseriales bacterium]|nr:MAG: threonine--tRNA ligase [Neisseriales bacterium]
MIDIQYSDGTRHTFDHPITVLSAIQSIDPVIFERVIAGLVDDKQVDLRFMIDHNATLSVITDQDEAGLAIIRHSTAHLLAHAVKSLFPEAQVAIGPVIENGFYYDFAFSRAFTPADLDIIEEKMRALAQQNLPIDCQTMAHNEAIDYFKHKGEHYKCELIAGIPQHEAITLYSDGQFTDLCRGPHVLSTGKLVAFKLTKLAGAYWRGDSKNEMLQRIYGTAWANQADLAAYLNRLTEAEKRDHRKLGQTLDLFHLQEEAPGSVFWHPKGWRLFQTIIRYMRHRQEKAGYVEVNTPDVMDKALWEISGHWFNYRENMFVTSTEDGRIFALKPMNCPGSVSMFSQGIKSYRDLPIRMAEFGKVHRYEASGGLHGLLRVRHFTQDDAHIYCTEAQVTEECCGVIGLILDIYKDFGFDQVLIKLSTRPDNRIGSEAIWDKLEQALSNALNRMQLPYQIFPKEGAFYGPKIEFVIRDAIGRDWQCGTLQMDMNLPERFNISYIAEDNTKCCPVMLHTAFLGSLERFLGILIEHYAGNFPFWLVPIQLVVITITDKQVAYAGSVFEQLKQAGFRCELDVRNEKIGYKLRQHSLQKRPFQIIVGDKEVQSKQVAVRQRGEDLGQMTMESLLELLSKQTRVKLSSN